MLQWAKKKLIFRPDNFWSRYYDEEIWMRITSSDDDHKLKDIEEAAEEESGEKFYESHQKEYHEAMKAYRRAYRKIHSEDESDGSETDQSEYDSIEFIEEKGDNPRIEELSDADTSSPPSTGEVSNHRTELELENPSNVHTEEMMEDMDHNDSMDIDGGEKSSSVGMDSNFDNGWSSELPNMEGTGSGCFQHNSFTFEMDYDFSNDWQQNNDSSAAFGGSFPGDSVPDDSFVPEMGDLDFDGW